MSQGTRAPITTFAHDLSTISESAQAILEFQANLSLEYPDAPLTETAAFHLAQLINVVDRQLEYCDQTAFEESQAEEACPSEGCEECADEEQAYTFEEAAQIFADALSRTDVSSFSVHVD